MTQHMGPMGNNRIGMKRSEWSTTNPPGTRSCSVRPAVFISRDLDGLTMNKPLTERAGKFVKLWFNPGRVDPPYAVEPLAQLLSQIEREAYERAGAMCMERDGEMPPALEEAIRSLAGKE